MKAKSWKSYLPKAEHEAKPKGDALDLLRDVLQGEGTQKKGDLPDFESLVGDHEELSQLMAERERLEEEMLRATGQIKDTNTDPRYSAGEIPSLSELRKREAEREKRRQKHMEYYLAKRKEQQEWIANRDNPKPREKDAYDASALKDLEEPYLPFASDKRLDADAGTLNKDRPREVDWAKKRDESFLEPKKSPEIKKPDDAFKKPLPFASDKRLDIDLDDRKLQAKKPALDDSFSPARKKPKEPDPYAAIDERLENARKARAEMPSDKALFEKADKQRLEMRHKSSVERRQKQIEEEANWLARREAQIEKIKQRTDTFKEKTDDFTARRKNAEFRRVDVQQDAKRRDRRSEQSDWYRSREKSQAASRERNAGKSRSAPKQDWYARRDTQIAKPKNDAEKVSRGRPEKNPVAPSAETSRSVYERLDNRKKNQIENRQYKRQNQRSGKEAPFAERQRKKEEERFHRTKKFDWYEQRNRQSTQSADNRVQKINQNNNSWQEKRDLQKEARRLKKKDRFA